MSAPAAFLLYFSRPITRLEYVAGKFLVVCANVSIITTAPALALYVFGVLLSPDLQVLRYTWDFPLRILLGSLVLMIPTTSLALAFSSLTTRSYYAAFAWFSTWAFGFITYTFLSDVLGENFNPHWSLISLHHALGIVQGWIFGLGTTFDDALPSLLMLCGISIVSLAVVFQRISACTRI